VGAVIRHQASAKKGVRYTITKTSPGDFTISVDAPAKDTTVTVTDTQTTVTSASKSTVVTEVPKTWLDRLWDGIKTDIVYCLLFLIIVVALRYWLSFTTRKHGQD
jgi:hypothetical protein